MRMIGIPYSSDSETGDWCAMMDRYCSGAPFEVSWVWENDAVQQCAIYLVERDDGGCFSVDPRNPPSYDALWFMLHMDPDDPDWGPEDERREDANDP